jgi:hypothetical protein
MMRRTPMPRTSFKRKPPVRVTLPLDDDLVVTIERIAPRLYRIPAPSAPVFHQAPKHDYLRDRSYRMFVASQDCFGCGIGARSQAAHSNSSAHGHGRSIKASDADLFPLCVTDLNGIGCHEKHDQAKDGLTREQRRAREVEWINRMRAIARAAGREPT